MIEIMVHHEIICKFVKIKHLDNESQSQRP